jgi:hypothetical protein
MNLYVEDKSHDSKSCEMYVILFNISFIPVLCKTVLWLTGAVYRIYALHVDVC